MISTVSEEEIEFCECLFDPVCLSECLFSDIDNLSSWEEDKYLHLRTYQLMFLSYEYSIASDPKLSREENFRLLEGAGTLYNFGGRLTGKSRVTLILDIMISLMLHDGWEVIVSSYDHLHVQQLLEKVIEPLIHHPFFKMFRVQVKRNPYLLRARNGHIIHGINMNVNSNNEGANFFGYHVRKMYLEEASKETERVNEYRRDSRHEIGCIERASAMMNFVKLSPAGKVFHNRENASKIVNYPSFISPEWSDYTHKRAIEKHNGENSPSFKVFVLGEPAVDAMYAIDMQRVEDACINTTKEIKNLEVSKETYFKFKTDLIVEKPSNAERMDLAVDVGENVNEIVIVSRVNEKYKYLYNISLYQLTRKETLEILKFLIYKLEINVIGVDCGDGKGRDLYRDLEEIFSKDRELVWYQGNLKVKVDLLKDEKGELILENNSPVYEEEFHSEFSVRHLIEILYNGKIELPKDYKLLEQLGSVVAKQLGARTVFDCYSVEDHLFDCFRVWALSEWEHQRTINKKIKPTDFFGGIV